MKARTGPANDNSLPDESDLPICRTCGTPAQTTDPPMPVAGPLPVAPTPSDETPSCPECGAPWPTELGPAPDA